SARRVPALQAAPEAAQARGAVRVAFVGRPNVGKSSLINRILGHERFIVSEQAGTTREALDVPFTWNGRPYVLVDTAGIRRKARTREMLEKFSVVNALTALAQVDVAVLVVDAADGAAEQDAHIADYIVQRERALVLALNKWDLVQARHLDRKRVQADIGQVLRFVDFAAQVRVSARTGSGLDRLFQEIQAAATQFARQVQTADLNRVLQLAVQQTAPPARGRAPTKVFYGVQLTERPPRFRVFTNHPEQIRPAYTRYLEHQLREHLGFKGTPLGIQWRGRGAGKGKREPAEAAQDAGRALRPR
ncbi:MAG TPA: GTPase, partial [bacterium]|nr:GTPase [bacterium]